MICKSVRCSAHHTNDIDTDVHLSRLLNSCVPPVRHGRSRGRSRRCFLSHGDGEIQIHPSRVSEQENRAARPHVRRPSLFSAPHSSLLFSRVRSVTHKHLQKMYENTFEKIFNQQIGSFVRRSALLRPLTVLLLGFLLFKEFCATLCDEPVPQLKFYEEVKRLEEEEGIPSLSLFVDQTIREARNR